MSPRDYLVGLAMGLTLGTLLGCEHTLAMVVAIVLVALAAAAAIAFDVRRSRGSKGSRHG